MCDICDMYKIAQTRKEKLEVTMYWDNMRKVAKEIRDEFDLVKENAYYKKILEGRLKNELNHRPDFMEPVNLSTVKILQNYGIFYDGKGLKK